MATRSQNVLSLSIACSLVLFLALVLVNAVFARTSVRVDLTEESIYTLSEGSRHVLSGLGDPATLKVYWQNVPATGEPSRRYLAALLEEMRSVAGSRLTVRWVDLDSSDGRAEAERDQIKKLPFEARVGSEIRAAMGYSSLAIECGDAPREVVDGVVDLQSQMEYKIVSALARMTKKADTVVGLVSPKPPFNPFGQQERGGRFNLIGSYLSEMPGVTVKSYLTLDEPVAPDVKVLVVLGPQNLEEKQAFHLDQYVLRGGKLMLLLDPMHYELFMRHAQEPEKSGLEDWLGHLGLTVERQVAMDYATFGPFPLPPEGGGRPDLVDYPYWFRAMRENLDTGHPALYRLSQVPFYWPAPLSYDKAKNDAARRRVTVLATTTEGGARETDLSALRSPRQPDGLTLEKIPLALLVEGPMESFWKGKPSPDDPKPEEKKDEKKDEKKEEKKEEKNDDAKKPDGESPKEPPAPSDPEKPKEEKPDAAAPGGAPAKADDGKPPRLDQGKGVIVLVGDAELACDYLGPTFGDSRPSFAEQFGYGTGGFIMVRSLVGWLAGGEDLLDLRSRNAKPRTLDKTDVRQQDLLSLLNILGVPVLVLFIGIVVFFVRRYQR